MTYNEKEICNDIIIAINESFIESGLLNNQELKEYIEFIFITERSDYKNEDEMKKYIFNKIINTDDIFLEDIRTGEIKEYISLNNLCKDISMPRGSLSGYLNKNRLYEKNYRITRLKRNYLQIEN
jgi:hypothetical protein